MNIMFYYSYPFFLCMIFVHYACCTNFINSSLTEKDPKSTVKPEVNIHQSLPEKVTNLNESEETSGREIRNLISSMSYDNNGSNWNLEKPRSYSRRICKSLSPLQKKILINKLPKYVFHKEKLWEEKREIVLEIGFGSGEHFIHQAKLRPEVLFFGIEVYLNGVARVLGQAVEQIVDNILIFPNNLDLILNDLPSGRFSHIYILFPDPWPKKRQKIKRLVNEDRLQILQTKLKVNGSFTFSSDIDDYFYDVVQLITKNGNFKIINKDNYSIPHNSYVITKYHERAIDAGRQCKFLISVLNQT